MGISLERPKKWAEFSLDPVHACFDLPRSRRLYVLSCLGVWSACWCGLLFVGMLAVLILRWPYLVVVALPVFFFSQLAFIVLAFFFRCPSCGKLLFIQGWGPWHPARNRVLIGFLGIASWVAVARDIVFHRKFTCIHCGETCAVGV